MAKLTVMEYERVVRFVDGRVLDVLGPGRHRYSRTRTTLRQVDLRPSQVIVPGQEVLTADGVAIRISVVLRGAVSDPVTFVTASQDPYGEVYTAVQQALRVTVAGLDLDTIMQSRLELDSALIDATAARVGLEVHDLAVRDVMLPGDLRRAYAEVVLTRQRGKADLERARAESASLRSLANTADLLEKHPALLRLRTLHALESGSHPISLHQHAHGELM